MAIIDIDKSLRMIFPSGPRSKRRIHSPNAAFGGRTALDRMLGGELADIKAVQMYLAISLQVW